MATTLFMVHISSHLKLREINAGEKVKFDWKASGTNDAFDIFAYIVDVNTGATEILLNETQSPAGSTNWATVSHTVQTSGNYKYVFINGTYDDTGGKLLGAEMYLDNIYIERDNLPAGEQHTVDKINLQTIANAGNAVGILQLAISQTSEELSKFGALINRLKHSSNSTTSIVDNMRLARSRVFDASTRSKPPVLQSNKFSTMPPQQCLLKLTSQNNQI